MDYGIGQELHNYERKPSSYCQRDIRQSQAYI